MEVEIDFGKVKDWDSFHEQFFNVMGFPGFYGNNMDAWIDCMSSINDPSSGMSKITVKPNENLELIVLGIENATNVPEILRAFIECTAIVNNRFIEAKSMTRLKIIAL